MVGLRGCPEATFKGIDIFAVMVVIFEWLGIFGNFGATEVKERIDLCSGRCVSFKHSCHFIVLEPFSPFSGTRLAPVAFTPLDQLLRGQQRLQFSSHASAFASALRIFSSVSILIERRTSLSKPAADKMYIKQIIIQGFKRYYPCAQFHRSFELI